MFIMKILLKNKKGFLLAEETLKIILAVIGIGFLVFLLGSIYFNNVGEQKLKHAHEVLKGSEESLRNVIDSVQRGEGSMENGSAEKFSFNNPEGWSLFSFTIKKDQNIPRSCANKNCVCICDSLLIKKDFLRGERQAKECAQEGDCIIVSDLNKFEEIEIQRGVNEIIVSKNKSGIFIKEI